MKPKSVMSLVRVSACVLSLSVCRGSFAQNATPDNAPTPQVNAGQTAPADEAKVTRVRPHPVRVRNVKPSWMAHWIDPEHHPMPVEFRSADQRASRGESVNTKGEAKPPGNPRTPEKKPQGEVFALPEGIERVIAVDSQNVLLVYGTAEGVRELTALIEILDRPVKLVDITVRYIEIDSAHIKDLGVSFNPTNGPFTDRSSGLSSTSGTFTLGFIRHNGQSVETLMQQGKARQLGMSQLVIPNNLPGSASARTTSSSAPDNAAPILVDIETNITPTINADDSITVVMEPRIVGANGGFTAFVKTVANMRNGDTLALGGLRSSNHRDIVVLLTARKVTPPKPEE